MGGAEGGDVVGTARFLAGEVVAGEAKHLQALCPVGFEQLFQAGVLGRQATLRGDIDDEQDLAFVLAEVGGVAA